MAMGEFEERVTTEFRAVRSELSSVRSDLTLVQSEQSSMRSELTLIRSELTSIRSELTSHGEQIQQLDARITAEGEVTRRHFDIVAEQFKEYVKVLADGIGRNTERLDDHEKRITAVESRRS